MTLTLPASSSRTERSSKANLFLKRRNNFMRSLPSGYFTKVSNIWFSIFNNTFLDQLEIDLEELLRLCNSLPKMTTPKRIYSSFRITKRTMIATKIANFNTRLKRSSESPQRNFKNSLSKLSLSCLKNRT